jgi:hypothetical protein
MSMGNIISIVSTSEIASAIGAIGALGGIEGAVIGEELGNLTASCVVTFKTHGHGGTRSYSYSGADAEAILAGADPAQFSGTRVD